MITKDQLDDVVMLAQVRELARQQVELKIHLTGAKAHRKIVDPTTPASEMLSLQIDLCIEQLAYIDKQLDLIRGLVHSVMM